MKRFLIVMALMLALCVPWAHGQTLNEGFGGSAFPPDEWTTIHVSGENYFGVNSDAAYVNYASNWHENYLVTPQLAPKSGESLSFYVKTQTYSGTTLTIEVSTTGNAAADFTTTLATYTSPIATSYTLKSIDLSAYVGQNIYIAFHVVDHDGDAVWIDDVSGVSLYLPPCSPLQSLYASDITRTSITANWTKKTVATNCVGYEVKISTSSNPDDAGVSTAIIDNPATTSYVFSNLERNTTYYLHARSNCGIEDGYSDWVSTEARTNSLSECPNVTIADGTATNNFIPVYGYNCDGTQKSQSIYPASMLTDMVGKTISKLKYYVSSGGSVGISSSWRGTFNIRLMHTEATSLSGTLSTADATLVYTGTLTANQTDGMVIDFTTPFLYTGGNLLVEFDLPIGDGYNSCYFIGSTVASASYQTNNSSVQSFLPKVDFGYCETLDACPAVTNVAVADIAQTTANLSWTASTGDYANTYDVLVSTTPVEDFTGVVPTYTGLDTCGQELTLLTQYTDYYVYVRVNCDGYGHDDGEAWSEAVQFRTLSNCITPTDFTVTLLTKTSAEAQWTATSQASNYRYILSTEVLDDPDNETVTASGITANNVLLNNLTPGETYYLYLSNQCGGDDGNSPYISTTFTMPEACIAPTDLNITDVQKYQMTLNWTPSQYAGDGDAYDIYVSDAEILDFTGVEPTYAGVTGTSKVIDLLQRNTTYYVYLRCNCGEGVVTDWSDAVSATTLDVAPDCDNLQTIAVGNGSGNSSNIPTCAYYNYAISEQIYTASEIGRAGTINSISFYCLDNLRYSRNFTVYLAHTSKSSFSSKTDWVTVSASDVVYSGNCDIASLAWNTITFNTPFEYNGTDNLLVVIDDNSGSYQGSYAKYRTHTTDESKSIYQISDNENVNPTASLISIYGTCSTARNDIQFGFCGASSACPAVDAPVATDVTDTEATISWNAGTGDFATSYDLVISDTAVTDFEGVTLAADDVTETSFNAVGLSANTHYYTYVRVNCVNDIYDDGSSVWSPAEEFTTELPCLKPENFVAGSPLSDRVELSWTKKGTAVDWRIYVDTFDVEYTAWLPADTVFVNAADCQIAEDTVTYLLTGLQPVKAYTLALQSDCGEVDGLSKLALNTPSFTTLSNVTDIDTMVIHSGETMVCTIDRNARTINATVRKGTDLTGLFFDITFAESHCTAYLNGEELVYPFDFSEPVTARVFAQDTNVFADWTITVVEEPCATPFNVAATDIERRTANITWNIGDASTSFDFVISETELEDPATGTIQNITATNVEGACTYAVTGLTRGTHYYVYLRTNCGETYGQWRGTDFTTKSLVSCDLDVTVCDGTATDIYTPLYGSFTDNTQRVQTVYPASMLSDLTGKTISKLKYFVNDGGSTGEYGSWENATFNIRMMPYSSTTLYSLASTTSAQVVYSGTLKASVEEGMEINLTTPYTYTGGNLLIEFELPTATGYSDCVFYGVSESNSYASYLKLGSSTSYLHFRPKVEFLSCEESEACPEVTNVTIADIDVNSATVTWTESTGDYANASDIYYSTTEVEDFTGVEPQLTGVYGNSAELTGLSQYTIYYVYVRTHCDAEGHDDGISQWSDGTSFRTLSPCRVPGTPEATITGKHTATVAWTNTSESAQADNFTYILSTTPIAEDALETAEATETAYSNTTVDVTNLLCETTYHFYVKNVCTGDVNCSSPWDSCQFTMPVAMPAVINLQAFDIASNAFTAVWESDLANFADETEWEVACVPAGGTPETWTSVSAREHFAIGLTPSTSYDFYVRAKDDGNYSANAMVTVVTAAVPADCQTIGNGMSTSYGPICGYYGYERNIYLFYPEDGLTEGVIDKIAWNYTASKTIPAKIYLKNTTLTDLSSLYNGTFNAAIDGATLVYDASVTTVSGWTEIDITDFNYTGGNLMVLVASNYGGSGGASVKAYYTISTQASNHIASRKDSSYDDDALPMSSASSKACDNQRHNIQFCFAPDACKSVTNLIVDNITATSARAHWYPGAAETEWHVYNSTEQMTADDLALLTDADYTTLVNPQITYSDLTKDMDYYFYVRGNCGEGETSRWKEAHYITLPSCSAPATAVATSEADNSIAFTVTSGEYGTEGTYDYRYWIVGTTDTTTVAGQTSELTVNDLASSVYYAWEVRANCSGVDEGASRWVAGNNVHVCGVVTLPYSEGFETIPLGYSGPGMIETICWNDLNASASTSASPYYLGSTSYATEGNRSLQFHSSNVTPIYMIMPPIKDATECQVKFDCTVENIVTSGIFQVGYITDPADATTFVPAFTDSPTSAYTMQSHTVNIFNIPEGARIAFCYTEGFYANYFGWLDNVRVDTIPYYSVATAVAPEVTPAIGSVEIACNEGDTVSAGVFFDATAPVFTAVPNEGIEFINWTNANNGDTLATVNPWTINIAQDTAIVANFDTASFSLNVMVASGHDVFGDVAGSGIYLYGRTVNYSASPIAHYSVVWPDGNKDNNRSIVMPGHDTTIVASFEIDKHQLTVAMNDSSKGTVSGTGVYDYGTSVDITATPLNGHVVFNGWSNGETASTITIDLQNDSTVTALFGWDQHTVSTAVNDGTMGSVTGADTYTHNDVAHLVATPTAHHIFVRWSNGETNEAIDVTVVSDTLLTAIFDWDSHDISANVNVDSMGSVDGTGHFYHGTPVTLTAVPAAHHHFVDWSTGETTPSITVIADDDKTVTANFAIDTHTVSVVSNDVTHGSVTGGGTFNYGDTIEITATGIDPYQFARWDDGQSNYYDATMKVRVEGDATYTAYFKFNEYDVSVLTNDAQMGTVTGSGLFTWNTVDTLVATPAEHHHLEQWSNGSTDNPLYLTVTKDTVITAEFAIDRHVVTTIVNNIDLGTVSGAGTYDYWTTVPLIATPADHAVFSGWSNGETANPLNISLEGDTTITAIFTVDSHFISANVNDETMGSVTEPREYVHGAMATLTATANDHYHFVNWSNGITANSFSFVVDKDSSFTAFFAIDRHVVTTNVNNAALGSVTAGDTYNYGDTIALTATPAAHAVFTGWSNGETDATIYIIVAGDTTVTAMFAADTHTIAATANDAAMGNINGAGEYIHGAMATLTATANEHYHFVKWSNGITANSFSFLVEGDSSFTATFAIDEHVLALGVNNAEAGTVAGDGTYAWNSQRVISATANDHYVFTGWSDNNMNNPRTLTLVSDTAFTAMFVRDSHVVTANVNDVTMGTVTGANTYTHGAMATLTATANDHYHFVNWSNGITANSFSFLVEGDSSFTATFAIDQHTVTTAVNDAALGSVTAGGTYNYGDTIALTATPAAHAVFTGWSNGETDATIYIIVAGDTTVTAMFAVDTHVISANVNDGTMGTVSGANTYTHGTLATLTATANEHYHFVNWSNGITANSFSFLVEGDSSFTATFAIDEHVLTLDVNNADAGTVTGDGTYEWNSQRVISATANEHYVFNGWSDGDKNNPRTLTLVGDTAFTAMFIRDSHNVTANVNDGTMGYVSGAGTYVHDSLATLTATAYDHYHFVNWSNGVTANMFSFLVNQDSAVTAFFAADSHVVTAVVNDAALGSVDGAGTYDYGTTATLTATPAAHALFIGWSNGAVTPTININVTSDTIVTAMFTVDSHVISATANDDAMGTVVGAGTFIHGSTAILTAIPTAPYHFVNWSNGETTETIVINVTMDSTLIAYFSIDQHNVTVNVNDPDGGVATGSGIYSYGDTVMLKATANEHYSFTGWSNGETDTVIYVIVNGNLDITANFTIDQHAVNATIEGVGTVKYCGYYDYGSEAVLEAIPGDGWIFQGWDNGETSETLTITVTCDTTVHAVFVRRSSVDDTEADSYVAYAEYNEIVVTGAADHTVAVYDMNGRLVKAIENASDFERINVNVAGVYVIRVSNMTATRVVVK